MTLIFRVLNRQAYAANRGTLVYENVFIRYYL